MGDSSPMFVGLEHAVLLEILTDHGFVTVSRVRRAQGRKPPEGENLHLLVEDAVEIVKRNSLDPVEIRPRADA